MSNNDNHIGGTGSNKLQMDATWSGTENNEKKEKVEGENNNVDINDNLQKTATSSDDGQKIKAKKQPRRVRGPRKPLTRGKKWMISISVLFILVILFGLLNYRYSILFNLRNNIAEKLNDHELTRYELSEMLSHNYGLEDTVGSPIFTDVNEDNEYYSYVQGMGSAGFVDGETFDGDQQVTGEYLAYVLGALSNRQKIAETLNKSPEDEIKRGEFVEASVALDIVKRGQLEKNISSVDANNSLDKAKGIYFADIDKENRMDVSYADGVAEINSESIRTNKDGYTYELSEVSGLENGQNIIIPNSNGMKCARKIVSIDGNTIVTEDADLDEVITNLDVNYYHEITEEEFLNYLDENYEEYSEDEVAGMFEEVDVSEAGIKDIFKWFTSDKSDYEKKYEFDDFHVSFMVSASDKAEIVGDKDNTVAGYMLDENSEPKMKESSDMYFKVWWGDSEPKIYAPVGSAMNFLKKLKKKDEDSSGFTAELFEREFISGKITIYGDMDLTGMSFYVNAKKTGLGKHLDTAEIGVTANINVYNKIKVSGEVNVPLFLPIPFTVFDIATVTVVPYFHVAADGTIQVAFDYDYSAAIQYSRDGVYKNNLDNRFNIESKQYVTYPRADVPNGFLADGQIVVSGEVDACLKFFEVDTFKTVVSFGIGAEGGADNKFVDDSKYLCTDLSVGYPRLSFKIVFGTTSTKLGSFINIFDQLDGKDDWPAKYEASRSVINKKQHIETQEDGSLKAVKKCTRIKTSVLNPADTAKDKVNNAVEDAKESLIEKLADMVLQQLEKMLEESCSGC